MNKNRKSKKRRKKLSTRFKGDDIDVLHEEVEEDKNNEGPEEHEENEENENTSYSYTTLLEIDKTARTNSYDSSEIRDLSPTTSRNVKLVTVKKSNNHYEQTYPESKKSTNYYGITEVVEEVATSEKEPVELLPGMLKRDKEEKIENIISTSQETLFGSRTTSKSSSWKTNNKESTKESEERKNATSTRKVKTDEKDHNVAISATPKILKFEKITPEYSFEFEDVQFENVTFNFTDDEIEKSLKTIVKNSFEFDFGKAHNCSEFQWKYSIKAFECAMSNLTRVKNASEIPKLLLRAWKIARVWMVVYLCLAIPCWCHKGWCCCCFRCKLCFPRSFIKKEKKYYVENPPGLLLHRSENRGEPLTYEPSLFETAAYEKFGNTLQKI